MFDVIFYTVVWILILIAIFAAFLATGSFVLWAPPRWDNILHDYWRLVRGIVAFGLILGIITKVTHG